MPTSLTPDQMKQFVRRHFEEFVNNRNAAVIHTNMTSDFCDHDGPGGAPADAAGDERMMLGMYKAMPDLKVTIEDMLAEGDKVVCRNVWRWTDAVSGRRCGFAARALALRGGEDRRALGHGHTALRGSTVSLFRVRAAGISATSLPPGMINMKY